MATFSITLNLSDLRAALITAGNRDIRYYLNGVLLDIGRSGKAWIVGTDGHRMSVIYAGTHHADECQVIIPRELVEKIKAIRTLDEAKVSFDGSTVSILYAGATYAQKPVDGRFPCWRRVVPTSPNGEVAQFNIEYLADFAKVAKLLGRRANDVSIMHGGAASARVTIHGAPRYFAALMPMRMDQALQDSDIQRLMDDQEPAPAPEVTSDADAANDDRVRVDSVEFLRACGVAA